MDMSKLPRMSQSPAPPPPPVSDQPSTTSPDALNYESRLADTGGSTAAEAWISIAIGAILMLMSPRIWQYLFSSADAFAQKWTFSDTSGAPLPYTKSVFFWGDLAITTFALVLVIEGLVLAFARTRPLVLIALLFTVITVALNLVYLIAMMNMGYGLQILSALAVAFGVYIALFEWRLLQALRPIRPPAA
jgi:hypothetical protein